MMNKKKSNATGHIKYGIRALSPLLYSLPETSPARRMHHRRRMQKKKLLPR